MNKIILASQSARRKQLLEWAEVDFEIVVKETDESFPPGLKPADAAIYIAMQKIKAVRPLVKPGAIILAADTIVVWNGKIIGKPTDRDNAIEILETLSGQQHTVITGVALEKGEKSTRFSDSTEVSFHELTREQIEFYVDKYKPYDKAGAYAIQEWIGVVGIRSINGDFYNVMGLPVSRVLMELRKFG
ncbi:MAG TPA: Maf family nucleotide pyrophosphatase [Chitinophagaceae bacterium]|nr:Maf family nucleotide pyrophosphatase [Chitinophagaceae bacterium]